VCIIDGMSKTRTQFHLSQVQRDWLKKQTEETGVPAAVVVRRLIDAAMEKTRASPKKGAAGKAK
jgi:hypothetical protein